MEKDRYLFCPGPVLVSHEVRRALLHPQVGHRVPYFEKVIQRLQENLLQVFKANQDYAILLVTASGTAANETVIASYFTPQDEVLLVNNGEFGSRLEELLQIHEVRTTVLNYEWGQPPRLSEIETHLKNKPGLTAIAMCAHETSTGLVHPVTEVGRLARRYGKTYFIDGISAVGGEDLDVVRDQIDFCTCSANKCLASFAGVGIICARKSKLEESKDNKVKIAYLNLYRLYDKLTRFRQTPNTPSVTMFIALDAAVERLLEEGLEEQIARHKRCARIIREGLQEMGLKMLVQGKQASNTVTSVFLPPEIQAGAFIQALEDKGYTIYAGKGPLQEKNLVQIANMGAINEEMSRVFLQVMSQTLKEFRARGAGRGGGGVSRARENVALRERMC